MTTPNRGALEAERQKAAEANPSGVTLEVAIAGGRRRFAEGEPILLDLMFASSAPEPTELDLGDYDRSGRLWSESFRFDPEGSVIDPLADYFAGRSGGLGGIRAMPPTLTREPKTVQVTLNEWARFAGPGHYRFYVNSSRPFRTRGPEGDRVMTSLEVTSSNVVELEIVHDTVWADKELARIESVLASSTDEDATRAARRALRFLTTASAARAMVADLCRPETVPNDFRWDTQAGLYGSPDRKAVIAMLREGIARPDCAVSKQYLDLVTRLSAIQTKASTQTLASLRVVREPILAELVAALPKKTDAARPLSLYTALGAVSDGDTQASTSAQADALRKDLSKMLGALPDGALLSLLQDQWSLVRSPVLAPALLELAREARPRGGMLQSLSDVALSRLVELDYETAKSFILSELARGARSSFSGATLGRLRDKELPSLDSVFVASMGQPETDGVSLELRAELFSRYASKNVLKDAWVAYRAIPYFRVALLGYLSKNDPLKADAEILRLPDFDSLQRLSKFVWVPSLEQAVVAKLGGFDMDQAARLLAQRGSPGVEKLLWSKLRALRAQGADRSLTQPIRHAIVQGKAWMTPPDRLRALAATCEDEPCKKDVANLLDRWGEGADHPTFVLWSLHPSEGVTGWLAHYDIRSVADLEMRIGQLPKGVTLAWQTKPEDVDPALMADVRRWAAARSVTITSTP